MNDPIPFDPARRELLRSAARYALLGGIGLTAGWLAWRGNLTFDCRRGACGQCGSLAACSLPQAEAYRRHGQGGGG